MSGRYKSYHDREYYIPSAAKEASNDAAYDLAKQMSDEAGFPEIARGTNRQKKWATTIRYEMISSNQCTPQERDALSSAIRNKRVRGIDAASFWIDRRTNRVREIVTELKLFSHPDETLEEEKARLKLDLKAAQALAKSIRERIKQIEMED